MFDLRAGIRITIGSIVLTMVNEVEIIEAIDEFTTTATLKVPKRVFVKSATGRQQLAQFVKTGDAVKIEMGYNGKLRTEFVGYLARSPKPTMPLELECEDEMYNLKRSVVPSKYFANTTLLQVIEHIAPGYELDVLNITIDKLIIGLNGPMTAAQVLAQLKDEWGLQAFFRLNAKLQPVLVVGKPQLWTMESQRQIYPAEVVYHLQQNVAQNSLEYVAKEDARVKMEYKLRKPNGSVVESDFKGDADGEVRSILFTGVTIAEVNQWAREDYEKFKKEGYRGDVVGFGTPYTRAGQVARIMDEEYELRDSRYVINKVVVTFGQGGMRRTCTLGYKV